MVVDATRNELLLLINCRLQLFWGESSDQMGIIAKVISSLTHHCTFDSGRPESLFHLWFIFITLKDWLVDTGFIHRELSSVLFANFFIFTIYFSVVGTDYLPDFKPNTTNFKKVEFL